MVLCVCKCCNKKFEISQTRINDGRGTFCSRECNFAYRKIFTHCKYKQYSIIIKDMVYNKHYSQKKIMKELKLSKSILCKIGKEFNIDYNYKNHPDDKLTHDILKYYCEVLHYDAIKIANELNLSPTVIRKYLNKYELKRVPYIVKLCPNCGKIFMRYLAHKSKIYCSKNCYTEYSLINPEITSNYIDGRSKSGLSSKIKSVRRRKYLEYNPLNKLIDGYVGHHINRQDVLFIPAKLHLLFSGHGLINEDVNQIEKLIEINTIIDILINDNFIDKGNYKEWI